MTITMAPIHPGESSGTTWAQRSTPSRLSLLPEVKGSVSSGRGTGLRHSIRG
jgi:hypothetical protein